MDLFCFLLALVWVQVASSHMVMNTPTIYSPDRASTWPVTKEGRFPYPCQGFTEIVTRTHITAGGSTLVNFTGSGAHGGGTCLFGLNYYSTPTSPYSSDPEHFKTIYTIIGGCPAETAGNLEDPEHFRGYDQHGNPDSVHCGNDTGIDCIRQFNIPFPVDLPSGNATFVWMWYNQRTKNELYMTCAPVYIDGQESDAAPERSPFLNSLPTMFLANIPGLTSCATSQTGEQTGPFNVPNPGNFGVQLITPDPIAAGNCSQAPVAPFASAGNNKPTPAFPFTPSAPSLTPSTASSKTSFTHLTPSNGPSSTHIFHTYTKSFSTETRSSTSYYSGPPVVTPWKTSATTPVESIIDTNSPITETAVPAAPTVVPIGAESPVDCDLPLGTLVCIGEHEFGICDVYGKAFPQRLNDHQICIDGKVVYDEVEN